MTARRLAYLYDMAEVEVDPVNELYPFRDVHLAKLNNFRSRDALDFLQRHHQFCVTAGRWEEPEGSTPPPPPSVENDLDPLWNDFHSAFHATVPDGEEELARVLADAICAATAELPDGYQFGCELDRRYLEVETHRPDSGVQTARSARERQQRPRHTVRQANLGAGANAGEIPVAIVRTTDFPSRARRRRRLPGC